MSDNVILSLEDIAEMFGDDRVKELLAKANRLAYSVEGLAEDLGCSPNHIRKFINSGDLPSFKLGQLRRINRETADEFRFKLEREHTAEMIGDTA